MTLTIRNLIVYIINIGLGIVTFFLGFRIIFQLFAANPNTPFVSWIYSTSLDLMSPFLGIFPNLNVGGGSVFDLVALITLVAYTVITQLLVAVIDALTRPILSNTITTEHTHI